MCFLACVQDKPAGITDRSGVCGSPHRGRPRVVAGQAWLAFRIVWSVRPASDVGSSNRQSTWGVKAMLRALLTVLGLLGPVPQEPIAAGERAALLPTPDTRAAYEAARKAVGRDADAHVRLALWCEQNGLMEERAEHLTRAVQIQPDHALARSLLGQVHDADGHWVRAEPTNQVEAPPARAEYLRRRAAMQDTAEAHWQLALWCEQQGLKDEARAHLHAAARLEPNREAAWKRLGYKKVGGVWLTAEQVEARRAESTAQTKADARWRATLDRLRNQLGDDRKRAEAERQLAVIRDPRAARAIWASFVAGRKPDHVRAVQLFGQLDGVPASQALAALAVFSPSAQARQAAGETLRHRDAREYLEGLIALVRKPIEFHVEPSAGPGQPGRLVIKGEKEDRVRLFTSPPIPSIDQLLMPGDFLTSDEMGLPVLNRDLGFFSTVNFTSAADALAIRDRLINPPANPAALAMLDGLDPSLRGAALAIGRASMVAPPLIEDLTTPNRRFGRVEQTTRETLQVPLGRMQLNALDAAERAQRLLESEVAQLDAFNSAVTTYNSRVLPLLEALTGEEHGADPAAWSRWWIDRLGYVAAFRSETARPTIVEQVVVDAEPVAANLISQPVRVTIATSNSCFAAGTPVHTREGLTPIEQVRRGDLVLTEHPKTGALSWQPVLAAFHNRPDQTLRIDLGGETIVATGIHRFWVAGRGWVMARDLKAGDPLRTLGGVARVASVETDTVQPVFNLLVAEGHSFLVGRGGAVVHDYSLVQPVSDPFDAPGPVASAAAPTP
jgi:tetratricopeptide (TPR) repeat protein